MRVLLASLLLLAACDAPPAPSTAVPPPDGSNSAPSSESSSVQRQRQIAFLNRIRAADPDKATIDRALLNEQNELGLVLDRRVEMAKIPDLMRSILTQMAREFPGQDLTVIAYTPSTPPQKIGTARLKAQSGEMNYTPEK